MASLPLLMVYYVTYDRTDIVVPVILRPLLGTNVDLSILVCKGSDEKIEKFSLIVPGLLNAVLRLHGNARGLLHERHQYTRRYKWARGMAELFLSHWHSLLFQ